MMSNAAADTLEKVAAEFEVEVLSDLQEGRTQSLSKISSARREAVEAVAKILETGVKQAESVKRQLIGAAELEARNSQLLSLEKAVNEAFDSAVNRVSGSTGAAYEKALSRLIEEGVEVIGPKARVHCSAKDRKAVAAALRKLGGAHARLPVDEKPVTTIGGVVLTTEDGTVRFDNTFEARLERMRPSLRKEVAGLLTGSSN